MKQRCESKQFIAINDKLKMDARVYQKEETGKRARQQRERERECVFERQSIVERRREGYHRQ